VIEISRPLGGVGVLVRAGLSAGLLGVCLFTPGLVCAGRGFNVSGGRLRPEEELDEGGLFSSFTRGMAFGVAANERPVPKACRGFARKL